MKNAYRNFGTILKEQIFGLLGFRKNLRMPKLTQKNTVITENFPNPEDTDIQV